MRVSPLVGDLLRVTLVASAVVLTSFALVYDAALVHKMFADLYMNDFGKFYYSTRAFLDGQDMYGPNPATTWTVVANPNVPQFLNMNPPHFHLLVLPLARLRPDIALGLWGLANVTALAWSIGLILKELGVRLTVARTALGILAVASCAATGVIVVTGQWTWLLLLCVTLAWIAARHDDQTKLGFFLGLAMSAKPFLLLFIPFWVLKRQWRATMVALSTVVGAFALGGAVFGVAAMHSWLHALDQVTWTWGVTNGSILGLLSRTLQSNPYFAPIVVAPSLVRPLWLVGILVIGGLTVLAVGRGGSLLAIDRQFALLILGALLMSPLGWVYYVWLPVGPLAGLVQSRYRMKRFDLPRRRTQILPGWRSAPLWASLPGLFWPYPLVTAFQPSPLATVTLGSVYFWVTLLLWGAVVIDSWLPFRVQRPLAEPAIP